ncbi:mitochondrial import inner membrane translocase subunit TIM22-like [Gossypium australe]|uniref:Mitochondrial import inner membrane translocase subunit TIM22-like n=1 Tax=Gossypium australe TaxID=47621 RepID=A0A5B6W4B8_9ROSI|nr:mitochondrial import inner membrane translocase subunit TIM22-like [Gossypium australe]
MARLEEKQGTMVPSSMPQQQNPLQQLQAKFKEVENGFRAWLSKQPLPVEATVVTTTGAAQGAAIGALMGGPLVQARNFAVMTGVNAGISCVMKRLRGKEDVQSSMAAAFGSGAMFSLVSGMGGPNQAANAVTSGLFFALVQGGLFQLGQKFSQPPVEDVNYYRTRSMLNSLGLQNYEKNFKKGLLTDSTLPLLTDRQAVGLFSPLV